MFSKFQKAALLEILCIDKNIQFFVNKDAIHVQKFYEFFSYFFQNLYVQ